MSRKLQMSFQVENCIAGFLIKSNYFLNRAAKGHQIYSMAVVFIKPILQFKYGVKDPLYVFVAGEIYLTMKLEFKTGI